LILLNKACFLLTKTYLYIMFKITRRKYTRHKAKNQGGSDDKTRFPFQRVPKTSQTGDRNRGFNGWEKMENAGRHAEQPPLRRRRRESVPPLTEPATTDRQRRLMTALFRGKAPNAFDRRYRQSLQAAFEKRRKISFRDRHRGDIMPP
jgi:hypothetical protein